jgi:hypothetical protein
MGAGGFFRRSLKRFNLLVTKKPFAMTSITTGVTFAVGDCISQTVEGKRFDVARTARFSLVGFLFVGPVLRMWYVRLDKLIKPAVSYRPLRMMAVDQLCFAPSFMALFLVVNKMSQGNSIQ